MADTMRAVEITQPGPPDVLRPCTRARPVPGSGEVLLKVSHAGVNRPDALQRAGLYDPPKGANDLPGLEASGKLVALGDGVEGWQTGDHVCALLPGGGYAEYAVTPAAHCLPVPKGLTLAQSACLPETCFTVWTNVVLRGRLAGGERLLVHGGSSGIGTIAIQLGHALGARVFATAGTDEKCRVCEDLGAERAFNYRTADFVDEMRDRGGADLILDMVGGAYIPRNIRALADDGRLVQIAFLQGPEATLNFTEIMTRRLTVTGSTLRPQSVLAKARIADDLRAHVWPLIDAGRLGPVMDLCFPLDEAAAAHARMEAGNHIGKIVLEVG